MTRPLLVVLAAAGLVPAACVRSLPPLERYRLAPATAAGAPSEPARPIARSEITRPPLATVRIEPYVTEGIYADPQIVYRTGDWEYGAYPNREWALPLSTMLGDITADVVRTFSGSRVRVVGGNQGGRPDLVWRGVVRAFEEVDRGDQVLAAVHLEAAVLRGADDSLLWQGTVHAEQPVRGDSMAAVVATLSRLGAEAVASLVGNAARSLRPLLAQLATRETPRPDRP
jgi:ABC-type uncharacterized transport system auxiliary subunit